MRSGTRWGTVILGAALVWGAGFVVVWRAVAWNAGFLHDDAFISLRYAQNWLAGNGVAWNPGDRVEGYTNFLQLLLTTGLGAVGVDLVRAVRIVSFAAWCGLLAFGLLRARASRRWATPDLASLPVVASVASIPLVAWVFGGLEAPLVALLVTVGALGVCDALSDASLPARRPLALAGGCLGLACLTRLDAGIFVAAAVAFLLTQPGRLRARVSSAAVFAAPVAVLLAPWLVWKGVYYGDLLPNTWYVKASDPSGWRLAAGVRYLGGFLATPPFALAWAMAGALRAGLARRLTRGQAFALTALALHAAWIVYVGGDQMPLHRLLVPVLPLSCWLAFALWRPDLERLGARSRLAVAGGVSLALALQLVWPHVSGAHRNATSFVGTAVGRYIARAWRPGSLVALNTAGSTPYHAPDLRYLDMLGLNDAHIARRPMGPLRLPGQRLPGHARGDGAYVLAQRPDYLILGPAAGVPASNPWFLSDLEIAEDPAFVREYAPRRAVLDVHDLPGYQDYPPTRSGALVFTWYERRERAAD
jgi:hypothetical protein